MYIKNRTQLIENGRTNAEREARELCLDAIEAGLVAAEPGRLMASKVRLSDNDQLVVRRSRIDLSKFRRIVVIGGGKAGRAMAETLESILGGRISAGLVNVPTASLGGAESERGARRRRRRRRRIALHPATHPLPSESGESGVRKMLELVGRPTEDMLVIALISGGGSAMLPLPREGVSLKSKIDVTRGLLLGGANIRELNVVRKHLSATKGGWLAKLLYPSRVVSLVISDVVGNPLDSIASGPLYPDSSTFLDVRQVLRKYNLMDRIPEDVKKVVSEGIEGKIPDTPKPGTKYFTRVTNLLIGSNDDACAAAAEKLRTRNSRPIVLTTSYEGEARSVGTFFGSIVQHSASAKGAKSYVAGGESTVTVRGSGRGGRNQEMVLGAAKKIAGLHGVALVSIGTDGIDGSSDAAGALSDGYTVERLAEMRIDPEEAFLQNDTHPLFEKLKDSIVTGPTGTNVNDISVAVLR